VCWLTNTTTGITPYFAASTSTYVTAITSPYSATKSKAIGANRGEMD
jgi:hypothetical protein